MRASRAWSLLLVTPALILVLLLFVYPLGFSVVGAFEHRDGSAGLGNFVRAWELYRYDTLFTIVIIGVSTVAIGAGAVAVGGYLTLGENPTAVRILAAIYRWPLFIPFIVAAQCMRTFLAQNGMMNNALIFLGVMGPEQASSFLDWRGIIITFVWKQLPFVALMVAGAMASLDRATIEAARNLGARRPRILIEIVVPQIWPTLLVGLILSFVTMMSVLSVPMMISGGSPTMLTVDMAYRINQQGDYGTANALGVISYLMTAVVSWIYLRNAVQEKTR